MKDFVPLGSGDSRYLKSVSNFKTLYPTFEAFSNALIEGTLPIDLNGVNPSGVAQMGTPLNKANLLADATETEIWGNAANRTVDAALRQVAAAANDAKSVVKLKEVTTSAAAAQVEFDLSDIDLDRYRELKFCMELLPTLRGANNLQTCMAHFNEIAPNTAITWSRCITTDSYSATSFIPGYMGETQYGAAVTSWTIHANIVGPDTSATEDYGRYRLYGTSFACAAVYDGSVEQSAYPTAYQMFIAAMEKLEKLILTMEVQSYSSMIAAGAKLTVYGVLR